MTRRTPPWVTDAALGIGLFALSLISLFQFRTTVGSSLHLRDEDAFGYVLIALQTLPLVWRRRFPVSVAMIVLAAWIIDRGLDYPSTLAGIGTLIAIHAIGSELPSRRSLAWGLGIIGFVGVYTLIGVVQYDSVSLEDVAVEVITGVIALYLGREVNQRQAERRRLEERAESAEREREERARLAVEAERGRIARELHDVVAHQIVVMTVQAEGAARLAGDTDPRVTEALRTISAAGREGLAEMRRMVGLLREPAGVEPMEPQPGLGDLERLTSQFAEAGLPVSVHVIGEPRHLPSGVDINAYRIVQESLTNSLKHGGPGVSADVTISYRTGELSLAITDDGRGVTQETSPGHGLVGMNERVALLSGELAAGPRPGGGFRVHARIPVDA